MAVIFAPTKLSDFRLTGHQYCCADSLTDAKAPDGTSAIKYLLRPTDARISSSIRAEAELPSGADSPETGERWYGLSYWFDTYEKDPNPESILQFHDNDGTTPPLSIHVNNGRLLLMQSFLKTGNKPTDIGVQELGKWVNIVLHVKWTTANTGLIEVWKDGVKVINITSAITNSKSGSYGKYGINKWSWDIGSLWSTIKTPRIFYITNVKIGNETSSYNEVAPGAVVIVPPPPPPPNQPPVCVAGEDQTIKLPVNSVTLNGSASTDKDGKIVSYQWTDDAGNTLGTTPIILITNLIEGRRIFNLTVTDDKGAATTDGLWVTILPADVLPVPKITAVHTTIEIDYDNGAKEIWKDGVKQ